MGRHVFYSLHYQADRARAELVRKVPGLVPNQEAKASDWATLQRTGEFAIKRWFEQQARGRSCCIVLIGAQTASRPWIRYEIERSWQLGLGLLGIYIHHLRDEQGRQSSKGDNPFQHAGLGANAALVNTYDPPETDSKLAYRYIADNLEKWVEQAMATQRTRP